MDLVVIEAFRVWKISSWSSSQVNGVSFLRRSLSSAAWVLRLGMNAPRYVRKHWRSCFVFGLFMEWMSLILAGSGDIPSLLYVLPRNDIDDETFMVHLSELKTSPCVFAAYIKAFRFQSCSASCLSKHTDVICNTGTSFKIFGDFVHALLEDILANVKAKW